MFQIHDIRQSRIYQEAFREGFEIGFKIGITLASTRMAAANLSVEEIARILKLEIDEVQQALKGSEPK